MSDPVWELLPEMPFQQEQLVIKRNENGSAEVCLISALSKEERAALEMTTSASTNGESKNGN